MELIPLLIAGVPVSLLKISIVIWIAMITMYAVNQGTKDSWNRDSGPTSFVFILLMLMVSFVLACLVAILIEADGIHYVLVP